MRSDVYAKVEPIMIPVSVVIPAPSSVVLHSFTVSGNSIAVFTLTSDVAVNSSAVGLESLMAVLSPVPVAKCRLANRQRKREC